MTTTADITLDLARRLVDIARRSLRDGQAAAVDEAVACFVERPAPSTYLQAVRQLAVVRHRADQQHAAQILAPRRYDRAQQTMSDSALISDEDKALLAQLPVGPHSGPRLSALCALLEAHEELAGRIRRLEAERRASIRALPVDNPRENRARPNRVTKTARARR